jgi:hypothetical protein
MRGPLIAIGFWASPEAPELPDPRRFVDERWDPTERDMVIDYLRRGFVVSAYLGKSACRLCDKAVGSLQLSDGVFAWPDGLAHYLEAHDVRLPPRFVEHVSRRTEHLEAAAIDRDWWISQKPEG